MAKVIVPAEFAEVRESALRAIFPLKPAGPDSRAGQNFLISAVQMIGAEALPPYHLVYFLLVDLLGFENLGRWEKIVWSIPVDLEGTAYLIDFRKLGLGIFADRDDRVELDAQRIAALLHKGVKAAGPFFGWLASQAVKNSDISVVNNGKDLFDRYSYFLESYRTCIRQVLPETPKLTGARPTKRDLLRRHYYLGFQSLGNARWLAMATIDAFFAWTEHILIHIAVLHGAATTADEVAHLAAAEWSTKFRSALDISDGVTKRYYDELLAIRRQLRNYVTHGAFGKRGEAFSFTSATGPVPVALDYLERMPRFSITPELAFDDEDAIASIDLFITFLWGGTREPARIYIQDYTLPLILPFARDGTYRKAMSSVREMTNFVTDLCRKADAAANMDW